MKKSKPKLKELVSKPVDGLVKKQWKPVGGGKITAIWTNNREIKK